MDIAKITQAVKLVQQLAIENNGNTVTVDARSGYMCITFHGIENTDSGMEMLKRIGVGKRAKMVVDKNTTSPWTSVDGYLADGTRIQAFCAGIPHTCHIETFTEKVPKSQTVTTGEMVEITRTRVVCLDKDGQQAKPATVEAE